MSHLLISRVPLRWASDNSSLRSFFCAFFRMIWGPPCPFLGVPASSLNSRLRCPYLWSSLLAASGTLGGSLYWACMCADCEHLQDSQAFLLPPFISSHYYANTFLNFFLLRCHWNNFSLWWFILLSSLTGLRDAQIIGLNVISRCLWGCFQEREAFQLVRWVKQTVLPNVDGAY